MIWYLLYPLRGTTEPPDLAPSHPLRRGFAMYGRYVACHVITAVLISATVATALIYPIPYLFTRDFVNGASYVPHHVWTVAQPITYGATVEPDIIMRSIWVHSSYMEALNADLLASALDLQNELLGDTEYFSPRNTLHSGVKDPNDGSISLAQRDALHISNGLTPRSWFFHSPLIYWQYSRSRILADPDILSTINEGKNQSNFANTTLRHSVVFSGKRFEDRRLVAADAIVITLLYLKDSPVGHEWERKTSSLPEKVADRFDVYPADGRSTRSEMYEFQFRPMSAQDILSLALAYGLALFYFLISLSKLRAVKSKIGLITTIVTQVAFSIMSSFTVCAIFKFDLSRIPQAAYPLVVFSMSLENILRLINAVILTPFEDSTSNRIGYAFGQTAHTALASSTQNLLILAGLSRLVSPGVSAFCVFAAVAIVFDFFYLSTFFLSVLSVDVRRMELGDALAKAALRQSRRKHSLSDRGPWVDGFFQGKIAWSTRIAGTVIMIGFVIIAQWHFFGDDHMFHKILRFYRGSNDVQGRRNAEASFLKGLHQARSHASWIRNQDHETAQEVIRLIKPTAYSYVARVFEPLVFVKKNSDRIPHSKEPTLLPAAYDFIHHQLSWFIVIVVVIAAALRLLMNYLLWGDDAELRSNQEQSDYPMVSIKSMGRGHVLDVAMLSKSKSGHILSVGLDRVVRFWDIRGSGTSYVVADGNDTEQCPFPILSIAIDDSSTWLALLSTSRVSFWNLTDHKWGRSVPLEVSVQRPAAFFFDPNFDLERPSITLVHRNGTLVELTAGGDVASNTTFICGEPVTLARNIIKRDNTHAVLVILIVSKRGEVYVARKKLASWETNLLELEVGNTTEISQIVPLPMIGHFALAASDRVFFVDADQGHLVRTFNTERMIPKSLQCTYSTYHASKSDMPGLTALTICYSASETGDCVVQTYVPANDHEAIYLRKVKESADEDDCKGNSMEKLGKRIKNPGTWHVLSDGSVIGIRQVVQRENPASHGGSGLRRRRKLVSGHQYSFANWEVWATSPCDKPEMEDCRSLVDQGEESHHLVVSQLGPKVAVGLRSVAFAFGNVIKLITVGGHERYDETSVHQNFDSLMNTANRRRKAGQWSRTRAPS
ncbi:hypothetical protein QQS21_005574 [Conoideocrella luteorostrata]|uniref:Sterol regulatory element-binding protein cleavage-activating protein n=1 Tax=Conoideocrella luteorostrata TaxID=1105319 RepID=A0AAJ0FUC6_9HYPO|nr:hypothetical protein QQS21_005574 [Conoideocrella luteorostrata]